MKILLTGADGQLGHSIRKNPPTEGQMISLNSKEFDITDPAKTDEIFEKYKPDVVINAAAYTAVDKAEEEEQKARAVNALAVKFLSEKCRQKNAFLIHISTDYVFDGKSATPYNETDKINPINIYGKTKAEGEQAIIRSKAHYAILRTSWVFSEFGSNFFKTMMKIGADKKHLKVVSDQIGAPTYSGDIATAISALIEHKDDISGDIFHFCGDEITNWADFARFIFNEAFEQGKLPHSVEIEDILSKDYKVAAKRPKNSVLDCKKINTLCDIKLSDWRGAVRKILSEHY
ncbi:MAG: dTDP-4-dehydrorhamnose reductase [Alphaproteobacteria bacterium]|nr:dTDP-4-dehydrorhamnose reductase [Alphaproteobacteria bacterium]HPF47143.1 dTDP-4-dehydrorhamnose reductase [Emcibacteraceae bacterium]